MRKYHILFMAIMSLSSASAANLENNKVRVVINTDGSVSYYSLATHSNTDNKINKNIAKLFLDTSPDLSTYKVLSNEGALSGYMVTSGTTDSTKPISLAGKNGFSTVPVSYGNLPNEFDAAYALSTSENQISNVYFEVGSKNTQAINKFTPVAWEAIKLASVKKDGTYFDMIPIPKAEFLKSLGESMLEQAKSTACNTSIRPKEFSVSASLAASIGLIVGGEGTVEFAATWETASLCK